MIILLLATIQGGCALDTNDFQVIGDVTRFGFYGMVMVMLFLGPLVHFKSGSLSALWMLVSFLSYTRWFGVMSIDSSVYFFAFMTNVAKSTNPRDVFSIGPGETVDRWQFRAYGVTDSRFLNNSMQLMLAMAGLVGILVFCMVLGRGEGSSCMQILRKKVQYSLVVLGWLLAYEDFLIYALLQIKNLEFSDAAGIISSAESIAYAILAAGFVMFVPGILYRHRVAIQNGTPNACEQWSILIENMRPEMSFLRYQFYSLYLFQRTVAAAIFVFADSSGAAQIAILITLETIVLIWLLYARPFLTISENILSSALQACVCLLLLFQACFLKTWSDKEQIFLSMTYVAVYWTGIAICLLRFGIGLYGFRKESESMTEVEVTKTEANLNETVKSMKDNDEKVRSQLPNDYYAKMGRLRSDKPSNKVVPVLMTADVSQRFGWVGSGTAHRAR